MLSALEASGAWDDTVIIFTSDHGDMCGSHGLRSKGPFVYDEIMRVPLYVKVPGVTTPGTVTSSLGSHVDLAATICALGGVDPAVADATVQGNDLGPVLADPAASVRDHILFAQDSAQTTELNKVRYALRGFYDGATKYARYYGVGGGKPSTGLWGKSPGSKLFDVDCAFDDNDHEWYDHVDGSPRAGQCGQRSVPPLGAAGRLRADAGLRAGVVRHLRVTRRLPGLAGVRTGPPGTRSAPGSPPPPGRGRPRTRRRRRSRGRARRPPLRPGGRSSAT